MAADNQAEPANSAGPEIGEQVSEYIGQARNDWFLQELVRWAADGAGFDVTLMVGGAVVSGRLISGLEYFKRLADQVAAASTVDVAESNRQAIEAYQAIYDIDPNSELPPPNYLHLAEARIVYANRLVPDGEPLLWRGRISSVSGFSIGLMATR